MAYTNDLVRLAVSAHVAIEDARLALSSKAACDAILAGYREGLEAAGRPFVLSEQHVWLRQIALSELRDPVRFWKNMQSLPTVKRVAPRSALDALEMLLPEHGLAYRTAKRVAGLGSLGRQRLVALAQWRGGWVAREAKALLPSACAWAAEVKSRKTFYETIIKKAVRCPDPFVQLRGRWILRRLAPDCSRIELADLPKKHDTPRLLHAMGWETANVHLGSRKAVKAIRRDLKKRSAHWLYEAVAKMMKSVDSDWADWRKTWRA